MRALGIIPARKGSKRLVGKNLRPLGGKPLVRWVIEAARAAKALDRLVVSSDDDAVLDLARTFDDRLPLRRPSELAADDSPALDYVLHALEALELRSGEAPFDVVVILQPSSPFTLPADIDGTVHLLLKSGADTAVSVVELEHAVHPFKMKVMDGDRLRPFLEEERGRMAARDLPKIYVRNCSVYATRRRVLLEQRQIIGDDCRGYLMPEERSLDINTERDLSFAEFLLARRGERR
jgi:CMP-N-acetylneuraminic acid synthetase